MICAYKQLLQHEQFLRAEKEQDAMLEMLFPQYCAEVCPCLHQKPCRRPEYHYLEWDLPIHVHIIHGFAENHCQSRAGMGPKHLCFGVMRLRQVNAGWSRNGRLQRGVK
jgi:hypothetical protein